MGTSPLPGLSVFLITCNEADRLAETLAGVYGLAAEIVVVDSGSTDATLDIARAAGARVISEPWRGYGPQKRFAEEQCAGPWLLNIDADEFVPPALADEIRALLGKSQPKHVAYKVLIADQLPDAAEPKRGAYGPSPVRLYRKDAGRYSSSPVHDRVELVPGSSVGRLRQRIHHRSTRSLAHQLAKINAYTDQQVADLAARGKSFGQWRLLTEMPLWFFKYYVLRKQFIHGFYGFTTSLNAAFGRYLRIAKLIEHQRDQARKQRKS
jgi:glycosyltransferase involved in cell wall biosynthesis